MSRKNGQFVKCSQCGREIGYIPGSRIRKTKRFFDTKDCRSEWLKGNMRGEKIYNWKGGRKAWHYKDLRRRRREKEVNELKKNYVKQCIRKITGFPFSEIPDGFVDSYRFLLLLRREIKSLKEVANGNTLPEGVS